MAENKYYNKKNYEFNLGKGTIDHAHDPDPDRDPDHAHVRCLTTPTTLTTTLTTPTTVASDPGPWGFRPCGFCPCGFLSLWLLSLWLTLGLPLWRDCGFRKSSNGNIHGAGHNPDHEPRTTNHDHEPRQNTNLTVPQMEYHLGFFFCLGKKSILTPILRFAKIVPYQSSSSSKVSHLGLDGLGSEQSVVTVGNNRWNS